MKRAAATVGLQVEIVASLLVVMITGLALAAVALGGFAVRSTQESALERLRFGARQLEWALASGSGTLADLTALARALDARALGGSWTVLDADGRELLHGAPRRPPSPEHRTLVAEAAGRSEYLAGGGFPFGDLLLVLPVETGTGERGLLVGRVRHEELVERVAPLLASGGWVLASAALVFVAFGAYLLRGRIVVPVRELSDAARRIAEGDLGARVACAGAAELAALAAGFNEMGASLEHQRAELIEAQRSLARSERLATTGRLAAGVAHEVGNPVAAILGYTNVLARGCGSEELRATTLERIRLEALRIRALVRELLDLARTQELDLRPHAPGELLEHLRERMQPQPLLAGVELTLALEAELPEVVVDARRVEQVLVNLVENAAHALTKISSPRIELRARRARDAARAGHAAQAANAARRRGDPPGANYAAERALDAVALEVADNGPGIDPENLPHIFDPFFTTKDPGQGTGLGLWNGHRIAELLGGRLEVASRPGSTCFSLILPAADTASR